MAAVSDTFSGLLEALEILDLSMSCLVFVLLSILFFVVKLSNSSWADMACVGTSSEDSEE